jgi:hypothetical protein
MESDEFKQFAMHRKESCPFNSEIALTEQAVENINIHLQDIKQNLKDLGTMLMEQSRNKVDKEVFWWVVGVAVVILGSLSASTVANSIQLAKIQATLESIQFVESNP